MQAAPSGAPPLPKTWYQQEVPGQKASCLRHKRGIGCHYQRVLLSDRVLLTEGAVSERGHNQTGYFCQRVLVSEGVGVGLAMTYILSWSPRQSLELGTGIEAEYKRQLLEEGIQKVRE